MKWKVVTSAVVLQLGITLYHATNALRPRNQPSGVEGSTVRSEPPSNKSDSFSPSLANHYHGLKPDHLPAAQIQSPESLLAAIELETDADRRSEALDRAVQSFSNSQLQAVLDSLMRMANPVAAELRERLIRRWAESAAQAAATWAARLPENSARSAALEQIAFAWSETDLASAVAWVSALPDGESRQAATLATAYEAARTDPRTALELARNLGPSTERDNLLVHALSQWAGADFTTAADWAGKVSDPTLRARLIVAATTAASGQDPARAATLIATDIAAGEAQDRAAVALVQRWAQVAPQSAAAWVLQFPESPARDAAVQNLVTVWTTQDAQAAGDWLGDLPQGTLRTVGIKAHYLALTLTAITPSVE